MFVSTEFEKIPEAFFINKPEPFVPSKHANRKVSLWNISNKIASVI
jgi:hypothetical protein